VRRDAVRAVEAAPAGSVGVGHAGSFDARRANIVSL
jgi:hypothetical protein